MGVTPPIYENSGFAGQFAVKLQGKVKVGKIFYMKNNNIDVAQKSNNKQARTKAGAFS